MLHPPVATLAKYADEGVLNLDDDAVRRIPPFTETGIPVAAVHDLQAALYREVA